MIDLSKLERHTLGPWTFGGRNSMEVYGPDGSSLLKMTHHSMWPVEWQIANAHLIAAAPELLDENKRLRASLSLIANSEAFKGGTFVRELQLIAREALKRRM